MSSVVGRGARYETQRAWTESDRPEWREISMANRRTAEFTQEPIQGDDGELNRGGK